jgi:hypothetical protein
MFVLRFYQQFKINLKNGKEIERNKIMVTSRKLINQWRDLPKSFNFKSNNLTQILLEL